MTTMFAPVSGSFLGFDRLFNELDYMLSDRFRGNTGYPPLNLYKEEDDGYSIELALAGFKKSDVRIEHDKKKNLLTISGDTTPKVTGDGIEQISTEPKREVIRQGLAHRKFTRSFTLADDLEVQSAVLEDGLLTVKLSKVTRPEDQPLLIPLA